MSKIAGSCLCGSVTYSSEAEPAMTVVCHCSDCQKQSGSPFSVNVLVHSDNVKMQGGSLTQYVVKGDSGENVTRNFCNKCGSPIATVLDAFGGMAAIKSGTLHDNSWVKPGVQIWCESKQTWATLADDLPEVPKNPSM